MIKIYIIPTSINSFNEQSRLMPKGTTDVAETQVCIQTVPHVACCCLFYLSTHLTQLTTPVCAGRCVCDTGHTNQEGVGWVDNPRRWAWVCPDGPNPDPASTVCSPQRLPTRLQARQDGLQRGDPDSGQQVILGPGTQAALQGGPAGADCSGRGSEMGQDEQGQVVRAVPGASEFRPQQPQGWSLTLTPGLQLSTVFTAGVAPP